MQVMKTLIVVAFLASAALAVDVETANELSAEVEEMELSEMELQEEELLMDLDMVEDEDDEVDELLELYPEDEVRSLLQADAEAELGRRRRRRGGIRKVARRAKKVTKRATKVVRKTANRVAKSTKNIVRSAGSAAKDLGNKIEKGVQNALKALKNALCVNKRNNLRVTKSFKYPMNNGRCAPKLVITLSTAGSYVDNDICGVWKFNTKFEANISVKVGAELGCSAGTFTLSPPPGRGVPPILLFDTCALGVCGLKAALGLNPLLKVQGLGAYEAASITFPMKLKVRAEVFNGKVHVGADVKTPTFYLNRERQVWLTPQLDTYLNVNIGTGGGGVNTAAKVRTILPRVTLKYSYPNLSVHVASRICFNVDAVGDFPGPKKYPENMMIKFNKYKWRTDILDRCISW